MVFITLQNGANGKTNYPKSVGFIIGTEFCERFSYYGMRGMVLLTVFFLCIMHSAYYIRFYCVQIILQHCKCREDVVQSSHLVQCIFSAFFSRCPESCSLIFAAAYTICLLKKMILLSHIYICCMLKSW